MNPINKNALRAAVLIHQHAAAAKRQDASIHLPEYSWNNLQQLRRRIELARKHGWHAAADRLAEDLPRELDDCRRELESVLLACQSRQTQRPLSSASEIYRDIVGLFNEFEEVDIGLDEHELSVTTDSIELEGIPLGRFQIRLDWRLIGCRSQPYRVVALDPYPPTARDDVTHPHVQNEQLCEGEGRPAIRAALAECRVYDLFMLVSQLLRTYGRGSAYVELADLCGQPHNEVYVAHSVMWRPAGIPGDCGGFLGLERHIIRRYSVRRNSISPRFLRQGFFGLPFLISQFTSALAFISKSTSAYTLVVLMDTWPSHARIVLMSTPARSRWVAVVWRIVWGLRRFFATDGSFAATRKA